MMSEALRGPDGPKGPEGPEELVAQSPVNVADRSRAMGSGAHFARCKWGGPVR